MSNWFINGRVRIWKPVMQELQELQRVGQPGLLASDGKVVRAAAARVSARAAGGGDAASDAGVDAAGAAGEPEASGAPVRSVRARRAARDADHDASVVPSPVAPGIVVAPASSAAAGAAAAAAAAANAALGGPSDTVCL